MEHYSLLAKHKSPTYLLVMHVCILDLHHGTTCIFTSSYFLCIYSNRSSNLETYMKKKWAMF